MEELKEKIARALCRQYELDDGFSVEQADRAAASGMYRNFIGASGAALRAITEAGYLISPIEDRPLNLEEPRG